MTGEPMHTTLEERMASGLFLASEHTPHLSVTEIATVLHMKDNTRRTSVINNVTMETQMIP